MFNVSKWNIFVFFVLVSSSLSAQSQVKFNDMIWNDSVKLIGNIKEYGRDWLLFSRLKSTDTIYSISQIKGFQDNDKIYEALLVDGKSQYYRKLQETQIALYSDDNEYVWRKGDSLYTFTRTDFRSVTHQVFGCNAVSKTSYSLSSLLSFSNQYDKNLCEIRYVANPKFGLSIGYAQLFINRKLEEVTIGSSRPAIIASLYYEQPLLNTHLVFCTAEVQYTEGSGDYFIERNSISWYFRSTNKIWSIPVGIKWIKPVKNRYFPFLKAGLLYSKLTDQATEDLIVIRLNNNDDYYTSYISMEDVSQSSAGFFIGTGIEIPCINKQLIHINIGYNKPMIGGLSNQVHWEYLLLSFGYSF